MTAIIRETRILTNKGFWFVTAILALITTITLSLIVIGTQIALFCSN